MTTRLLSFVIWAVVAVSAVFWLMRLSTRADAAPAHAVTVGQGAPVASADLSRLLGSSRSSASAQPDIEPAVDARFRLIGVVAARASDPDTGLALIAIDGKPPRPIGLGGVVDGALVLLAVNHRRADLGPIGGSPTVKLELPIVPEPSRSTRLPGAGGALANPAPLPSTTQAASLVPVPPPARPAPLPGVNRNSQVSR